MTIKELTFCILCSVNAANLATDEDLNNEKSSISTVEENVLITKNDWNTMKWGDLYFLFPHVSVCNICDKIIDKRSIFGNLGNEWGIFFNFLLSGVIEYKYMFHKKWGINIRLNLNNIESFCGKIYLGKEKENNNFKYDVISSFFSLDFSLEWIYKRKRKKIYSGSFCPISISKLKFDNPKDNNYDYLFWGFMLFKFEYDRRFYLNFGKIKARWSVFGDKKEEIFKNINLIITFFIADFLSIEFGLNIVGVNDWRKKRKENIKI